MDLESFLSYVMTDDKGKRWPNVPGFQHEWCEELKGGCRKLNVLGPKKHGKPIEENSLVLMADGSYKRLGDVRVGDGVITSQGRPREVSEVFEQGKLPVLEIKTRCGRSIKSAYDHPFLTPSGYVMAKDLAVGNVLANLGQLSTVWLEWKRPIEEYRLAGYFIGDGNVTRSGHSNNARITCYDDIEAKDIYHCTAVMGFGIKPQRKGAKKVGYGLSDGVQKWLRDTGVAGHNSHTKVVPSFVFKGNNEQVANYIGAYFACDGTNNKKGTLRKDPVISLSSVSKELLIGTQSLLLRFGIKSRLSIKNGRYNGLPHVSWRLTITGRDYVSKFVDKIPVYSEKSNRFKEWGLNRREFDRQYLPDEITSITKAGVEPCRCLSVEEDCSFTAQDFVVHNTAALSIGRSIHRLGQDPERKIKIISATDGEASKRGDAIIRNIRDNERIHKVFPHLKLESNDPSITRFNVVCNNLSGEPSVQTYGVMSTSEGGMSDDIIFDDAVDMRNAVLEPALRPKVIDKIENSWLPSLLKGGISINLSNAWQVGDFSQSLKANPTWVTWERQAVLVTCPACGHVEGFDPPDDGPVNAMCMKCSEPADVVTLWPEHWSLAELQELKRGMLPRAWGRMYMMNPISDEDCQFKVEALTEACKEAPFPGIENVVFMSGCDIASSKKGAYFIHLVGCIEDNGHKHLVAMDRKRGADINYQADQVYSDYTKYHLEDIRVEDNGVQKLVAQAFAALHKDKAKLPISMYTTTSKSKRHLQFGIPGLAGEVDRGEWTIWDSEGKLMPLVQEAKTYGAGEFFDTVMGWLFLREAFKKRAPQKAAPRGGTGGSAFKRVVQPQFRGSPFTRPGG